MKKSILIIGGLIISSGILFGQIMHKKMQQHKDPEKMVKFITKKMVKKLNLDEKQALKLEEINIKHFDQMFKLKEAHKAELELVLNEEQLTKLEKSPFGKGFGKGFGPMSGEFGHQGFGPMGGKFGHHGFNPMMRFGSNPEMMGKMHEKMEVMFENVSEQRKSFDSQLTTSEKEIISKFKSEMESNRPNWDENISMEDRKEKMEKKFKPLLDIAKNHKVELNVISKSLEKELPKHNEMMDCFKNNERFTKMKQVHFLMMEF